MVNISSQKLASNDSKGQAKEGEDFPPSYTEAVQSHSPKTHRELPHSRSSGQSHSPHTHLDLGPTQSSHNGESTATHTHHETALAHTHRSSRRHHRSSPTGTYSPRQAASPRQQLANMQHLLDLGPDSGPAQPRSSPTHQHSHHHQHHTSRHKRRNDSSPNKGRPGRNLLATSSLNHQTLAHHTLATTEELKSHRSHEPSDGNLECEKHRHRWRSPQVRCFTKDN